MRKALPLFALAAAMLCACGDVGRNAEDETAASGAPDRVASPPLELTPSGPPPSVRGCSCLLAEDPAQYRNAQEVRVQTGTMTLESREGTTVEQDVYGVCGC